MNSLPAYPYTEEEQQHHGLIDKKQPLASPDIIPMQVHEAGPSDSHHHYHRDQKTLPSPPPPLPPRELAPTAPPFEQHNVAATTTEPFMLRKPVRRRRRRCLICWLVVIFIIVLAAVFIFAIYGIPASHCCQCLTNYDQCMTMSSTVDQKACLDQFYTCSSDFNYVFFSCNERLYERRESACWIRYFK